MVKTNVLKWRIQKSAAKPKVILQRKINTNFVCLKVESWYGQKKIAVLGAKGDHTNHQQGVSCFKMFQTFRTVSYFPSNTPLSFTLRWPIA